MPVEALVSIISEIESGCSVWCSKTASFCGTPLSKTWKSLSPRSPTSWPAVFFTVARMRTSRTFTRNTLSCAASAPTPAATSIAAVKPRRSLTVPHRFVHSPSAQSSPSAKYSFFQIGTLRFKRSMPSRAAAKAASRCAAPAITTTLVSPISIRPSR